MIKKLFAFAALFGFAIAMAACSSPPSPTPLPTPLPFVESGDDVELFLPSVFYRTIPDCPQQAFADNRLGVAWFVRRSNWESELQDLCGNWWYSANASMSGTQGLESRWHMVWCLDYLDTLSPQEEAQAFKGYIIVGNEPNPSTGWSQCVASASEMGQLLSSVAARAPNAKLIFPNIIVQQEHSSDFSPDYIVSALNSAEAIMGRQAVLQHVSAVGIHIYGNYDVPVSTKVLWTRSALDAAGWGSLDIAVTEFGVLPGVENTGQTYFELTTGCLESEAIFCMGYTNRGAQVSCEFIEDNTSFSLTPCGEAWLRGIRAYYSD